ncbi:PrgI family protein, partial [Dysosmobacter welbionis]
VFFLDFHRNGDGTYLHHQAFVIGPPGVWQQHLISDIQHGGAGKIQQTDCAGPNQDLTRLIIQPPRLISRSHGLPQSRNAGIGRIVGFPAPKGGYRRINDMLRGRKVRFPQREADDILH